MAVEETGTQILPTKLYPPRLPSLVHRERLLRALDHSRSSKLTTVVAGAGYGKSTLVTEFLNTRGLRYVWYQLDESDRDLSVFLSYLVTAIGDVEGGFGAETLERLRSSENAPQERRSILTAFISEVDRALAGDVFVVLDDFQELGDGGTVGPALEFMCCHIPENLHFIILSRAKISFDVSELIVSRELVDLEERELRFTPEEIGALFSKVFGIPLEEEDARNLSVLTEGWVSGLVLFYHAFKNKAKDRIGDLIRDFDVPTAEVSDYLSRAVYRDQSDEVKDFLVKTSILSRMNPGFCDELLDIADSGKKLLYLTGARLFTIPLDDRGEWYRYHHFLAGFLRELVREVLSGEQIRGLHLKAAELWQGHGDLEQALYHFMEAGEQERAADVLERQSHDLRKNDRLAFLDAMYRRLPEWAAEAHPWLMHYSGDAAYLLGHYEDAINRFDRSASLFKETGETDGQSLSLLSAALLLRMTGRPEESQDYLERGLEVLPDESVHRYEALAVLSAEASVTGSPQLAERYSSEVLDNLSSIKEGTAGTNALFWCGVSRYQQGRFKDAHELLSKARVLGERIGYTGMLPFIYAVLSANLAFGGELEEALAVADKGLELSGRTKTPRMALLNQVTRSYVMCLLGRKEEAAEEISKAFAENIDEVGSGIESLLIEFNAGNVYSICEMKSEASEHFREAHRIAEANRFSVLEQLARVGMMYQSIDEVDPEEAANELEGIVDFLRGAGSDMALIHAYLLLAGIKSRVGRYEEAVEFIREIVRLGDKNETPGMLVQVRGDLNLALGAIFGEGSHMDFLSQVFVLLGPAALPCLQELGKSADEEVKRRAKALSESIGRRAAEPLFVRLLGPMEVKKGTALIPSASWKSKKALMILKYLAANRDRGPIPRDVVMELLWPERDAESTSRNLNVALSNLRKTLEPGAGRGESSYITVTGDSISLEPGGEGWVDTELFREYVAEAEQAEKSGDVEAYFTALHRAEELYRGDFLPEDLYEDWCSVERERLKEDHVNLIFNIAREHLNRGESDQTLDHLERALEIDPGREELYRMEMEIHGGAGNRAGIEKVYRRCVEHLREYYDVAPSPSTEKLYRKLRGSS